MPTATTSELTWFEVTSDGTTVTVKAQTTSGTTGSDPGSWSSVPVAYTSSDFDIEGGMIGLAGGSVHTTTDNLAVWADLDDNGSYETLVAEDDFSVDEGMAEETFTHDAAGNLGLPRKT